MLIHPWDAALDEEEWRVWLADGHDFGQLVVNGLPGQPPMPCLKHRLNPVVSGQQGAAP